MENNKLNSKKKKKTKAKETIVVEKKISFGFWFTTAIKSGKVQFWQDNEIKVFFRNRGLSDIETKERYDEILKLY